MTGRELLKQLHALSQDQLDTEVSIPMSDDWSPAAVKHVGYGQFPNYPWYGDGVYLYPHEPDGSAFPGIPA
jgi:hypothetical protein